MRAKVTIIAVIALVASAIGSGVPALGAEAPSVTVFEGLGLVCGTADVVPARRCVHDSNDPIWTKTLVVPGEVQDGLFWPGVGPAARGPFSLNAGGGGTAPPASFCASTSGGPGCVFSATGELARGDAALVAGNGAYCGSSHGTGTGTFRSSDLTGPVTSYTFSIEWVQSAATILPIVGTASNGQRIVGFTSSRGAGNGELCGAQGPNSKTTRFQVEGMTVTF